MAQDFMNEYVEAEAELRRIVAGLTPAQRNAWYTLNAYHEGFDGESPHALAYLQRRLRTRTLISDARDAEQVMNRWR